jgi:hypothetical protein
MKKILLIALAVIVLFILITVGFMLSNMRDRHADYSIDLILPGDAALVEDNLLHIGIAKVTITPEIIDTWVDADTNARYEPDKGDTFTDNNGNGQFDAYWLAGFHNQRPAAGVHDDIWARSILWDDGTTRVALVVLDAIGFFHDDVIDIRELVAQKDWNIDHVIVASTHNHEVPDLMGLWGEGMFKSGVNDEYMRFVKERALQSIGLAVKNSRPAYMKLSRIDTTAADLVGDSRPPLILDNAVHLMQFIDAQTGEAFGLLVNWGNHPETAGSDNLQITADFAHYWLEGIEKGIMYDGVLKEPGLGGTAIFANGAIGGLMTSLRDDIYDPWLDKSFKKSGFDKVRAQGNRLAKLVLDHLKHGEWETVELASINLVAKSFLFDLDNFIFRIGGALGVLDRGFVGFNKLRSEVDLLGIGPAWILTLPGEINPELVNGGIEVPEGADFPGEPVELPPFRQMMQGRYNFVIGLANDEVGYIMPRTHWDAEEPFTYSFKKRPYGEINSLGPESGPTLHREIDKLVTVMREITD